MKFDSSTISAEKLAEWAAIEAQARPPVRDFEEFEGRRLLWFVASALHVDGYVWADCYGMLDESDRATITAHVQRLLGAVEVHFDDELPL